MEAHKFYELEVLLKEFKVFIGNVDKDKAQEVGRTLEILEKEIADYEFERMEKIRQDNE
jgi:hypothetical protein